ncbi:HAMP domain-containing histidine kinase [Candidatus Saccharibacteria bacterium]|nr:HAMP domain-containing histidine kinase [Candidatus Saccharibacteria bacterium]
MESEVSGVDASAVVVAHELKAPLSLVRQLALTLEMGQGLDLETTRRTSERIVATSERALRQVQDLLRVARLEEAMFEMEPVNPRAVCDEVVSELWTLFKFNRREIEIDYRNKKRLAVANRQLLYSVVYNFCLNAMNYGGEELPSKVIVRDKSDKIRIEVRDYGPTVPTRVWREIKDGYVKRPVEIAMRPGSSGMGLYIAAKFANYMNSKFGLIRHRDGTSFYVDLATSGQLSMV